MLAAEDRILSVYNAKDRELLKDLAPLFDWSHEHSVISTVDGDLPLMLWLKRWREHILKDTTRKAYIVQDGSRFTLYVDVRS